MHLLCWKLHNVRDRRLNFVHSVVCSVLIVGGWVMLAWCRKGLFGAGWNFVHVSLQGMMHLLCWKLHNVRDRRLNFVHSVVCSVLIVGGWVMLAWCRKGLFGAGWNFVHVWRSYRNFWMQLGEYLVHAWLDLGTKLQKYTSLAYSWSTSVDRKK